MAQAADRAHVAAIELVQAVAPIGVRFGIRGLQRQRAIVARQRLLMAFQMMQRGAAIGVRLDEIRLQREGAVIA